MMWTLVTKLFKIFKAAILRLIYIMTHFPVECVSWVIFASMPHCFLLFVKPYRRSGDLGF